MRRLVLVWVGITLIALTLLRDGAAFAAGVSENFRILRFRPQWTSSDCIGEPKTPLCAAETAMACWLRMDGNLCGAIGWDTTYDIEVEPRKGRTIKAMAYHVRGEKRLTKGDIPPKYEKAPHNWRHGDVAVRMRVYYCHASRLCAGTLKGSPTGHRWDCPPVTCVFGGYPTLRDHLHPNPRITVTRKQGGEWRVVEIVTGDPQLPSSFWKRK